MENNIIFGRKLSMKKFIFILILLMSVSPHSVDATKLDFNMVFVPASEKGDDKDYVNLINIINQIIGK